MNKNINSSQKYQQMIPLPRGSKPFSWISIDFKGPLPLTSRNNKYILLVLDHLDKWIAAYPCSNNDSTSVTRCLLDLFQRWGCPDRIQSDRRSHFKSREFRKFLALFGIKVANASTDHPQTDGLVLRNIRILNNFLHKSLEDPDWDLKLTKFEYAMLVEVHDSSKISPWKALFRVTPRIFSLDQQNSFNVASSLLINKIHLMSTGRLVSKT
jgi:hypothetical protein